MTNLMTMDRYQQVSKEKRRKAQSQNQRFLRAQMQQKKENDKLFSNEKLNFQTRDEEAAPVESLDHVLKVSDYTQTMDKRNKDLQLHQIDYKREVINLEKSAHRSHEQHSIKKNLEDLASENKEQKSRKQEMQKMHKQIWSD